MEAVKLKYIIDISKHQRGRIEVYASDRESAKEEALSVRNRDNIEWLEKDWCCIDDMCYVPPKCPNCKIQLPEGSLYCNKCGVRVEEL